MVPSPPPSPMRAPPPAATPRLCVIPVSFPLPTAPLACRVRALARTTDRTTAARKAPPPASSLRASATVTPGAPVPLVCADAARSAAARTDDVASSVAAHSCRVRTPAGYAEDWPFSAIDAASWRRRFAIGVVGGPWTPRWRRCAWDGRRRPADVDHEGATARLHEGGLGCGRPPHRLPRTYPAHMPTGDKPSTSSHAPPFHALPPRSATQRAAAEARTATYGMYPPSGVHTYNATKFTPGSGGCPPSTRWGAGSVTGVGVAQAARGDDHRAGAPVGAPRRRRGGEGRCHRRRRGAR